MKKLVARYRSAAFFGLLLLVVACQEDKELSTNPPSKVLPKAVTDKKTLSFFEQEGFRTDMITKTEDEYIIEGDIVVSQNEIASLMQSPASIGRTEQARTNFLATCAEVRNISVRVDGSIPSSGTDNWRTEVQQAIDDWNGVQSAIRLVFTTAATADITVRSDGGSLSNNTIADARFPSGGNAGNRIRINLNFSNNQNVPTARKRYNMVHELGHCVGFRHTNWAGRSEGTGIHITGTPATDNNSVMNGGTANNLWNGFSNADQASARLLYPAGCDAGNGGATAVFYNGGAGIGRIYDITAGGNLGTRTYNTSSWSKTWDIVESFKIDGQPHLLFYDRGTGTAKIYAVTSTGQLGTRTYYSTLWRRTWDRIEPVHHNGATSLVFYDNGTGTGEMYTVSSNGRLGTRTYSGTWSRAWDIVESYYVDSRAFLLFYDRQSGTGRMYNFTDNGKLGTRIHNSTSWSRSWDIIRSVKFSGSNNTFLVFYDRQAGRGRIYAIDNSGRLGNRTYDTTGWSRSWDIIESFNVVDDSHLLFYDNGTGTGKIYNISDNGRLGALNYHSSSWSQAWDHITVF